MFHLMVELVVMLVLVGQLVPLVKLEIQEQLEQPDRQAILVQ